MVEPVCGTERRCGTCEFWDGARQLDEDGNCLYAGMAHGMCGARVARETALGVLDTITYGASNPDCIEWEAIATRIVRTPAGSPAHGLAEASKRWK